MEKKKTQNLNKLENLKWKKLEVYLLDDSTGENVVKLQQIPL